MSNFVIEYAAVECFHDDDICRTFDGGYVHGCDTRSDFFMCNARSELLRTRE
jgi:hypothetical protein